MEDGEDLNLVPAHAIWDDIGGLDDDEFARSRYPSQPAKVWMIAQRLDRRSDAGNETSRGARIIARDIVADRLEIGQRQPSPAWPQPWAEYFSTTRATSLSSANSPRSAAAIPD